MTNTSYSSEGLTPKLTSNKKTSVTIHSFKSRLGKRHEGWRGPWAAPCPQGVISRDRSTEGAETPPATGTAPKKHQSNTKAIPTLDPEGHVPTPSRLFIHVTKHATPRQTNLSQAARTSRHAPTDEHNTDYIPTHNQRLRAVTGRDHVEVVGHPPPLFKTTEKSHNLKSQIASAIATPNCLQINVLQKGEEKGARLSFPVTFW